MLLAAGALLALVGMPARAATVTILSETFEGFFPADNGWTRTGSPGWDDMFYRAYAGSKSAWCADTALFPPGPYAANMSAEMIYGPFSLSDAISGSITFRAWMDTESDFDYLKYMVSTNGSNYYGYQSSGSSGGSWSSKSIDLTNVPTIGNVCGQSQVWLKIKFTSDSSVQYEGAYVDNILIQKTTGSSAADLYDDGEAYRSFSPQTVTPGVTSFTVSTDIRNGGGSSADAFDVEFRASTNTTISASDYLIGSDFISSIAAGDWGTASWSGTFNPSPTIPAGTYWVGWIIDAGDFVVESNEGNNTAYKTGYQLTVPPPPQASDLEPINLSASPLTLGAGEAISFGYAIYNNGPDSATGNVTVERYLSTNAIISVSDTLLASGNISPNGLLPGQSISSATLSVTIPSGTAPGSYYFGLLITPEASIGDTNTSNNYVSVPITVTATPPDLYDDGEPFRSFTPQTVTPGVTSFTVSTRVRNGGGSSADAFDIDFYASTNTTISTADYLIGSDFISTIPAGGSATASWSGTFPSSIPAGTYWVGWRIDAGGFVVESNEGNNTAYKTGYQLSCSVVPPVTADSFAANPSGIDSGQSSTLTWTTSNATSVSISGVGAVSADGSTTVWPSATTTYTLTANGTGGPVTRQVTVTVNPPSVTIDSFVASPTSITSGQSSTLSWTTSNATSVSIDQGIGTVSADGSTTVWPTSTTTYTLTADGTGGPATRQVTVTVTAALPTNPNPNNGASGVSISTNLSWSDGGGATSYRVYFGTDSTPDSGEYKKEQTSTTYDPGTLSYSMTYYWRIDAKNSDGTTTGDVWSFTTELEPGTVAWPSSSRDFGTVVVGSSQNYIFYLDHISGDTSVSGTIGVSGSGFSVSGGGSYTLAPGDPKHAVTVQFAPTSEGSKSGTLSASGGGDPSVSLSGTGENPPSSSSGDCTPSGSAGAASALACLVPRACAAAALRRRRKAAG